MSISTTPISEISSQTVEIKGIIELVSREMAEVDSVIENNLNSDVALINQLGAYIIQAGGKRLRPVALLLSARACNTQTNQPEKPMPIKYSWRRLSSSFTRLRFFTMMLLMNRTCGAAEKRQMKFSEMRPAFLLAITCTLALSNDGGSWQHAGDGDIVAND